jgi:protein-disulfide isomerase
MPRLLRPRARRFGGAVSRLVALAVFAASGAAGLGLATGQVPLAPFALTSAAQAEDAAANAGRAGFNDAQKAAIRDIVKDYLLNNPEIMIDVQAALETKLEKEQEEKLQAFMAANARDIYRNPQSPAVGPADGDITVVEFFDYNCGYCKRGLPEIQKLLNADSRVRVVFKEYPILSKASEEAAKGALAAKRQDKYWEFHQAMLNHRGQANEATALKIAGDLGLDLTQFKADMAGTEVAAELESVRSIAKKMGINGTPHFLVGDKSIPGAPEDLADQLQSMVADFRKNGCSFC